MIKTEVIAIGDELLSGDVLDTNSAFLSRELCKYGILPKYHQSVGDTHENIIDAVSRALERSDLIFITGGLGPTDDDITVEAVAKATKRELVFENTIWENIQERLKSNNRPIDIYNKKQAYIPKKSRFFFNYAGTAPCLYLNLDNKMIFILPGVPSETFFFWKNNIKKIIEDISDEFIFTKKLKFAGISEAKTNEILGDTTQSKNPKIAFLAKSSEIIIKISSKSDSEEDAQKKVENLEKVIISKLKNFFIGYEEDRIESSIQNVLTSKGLTLAIAESCTGGLISKLLTDIPGSSKYIDLNVVTYSNSAKKELLSVNECTLQRYGAVSKNTAQEMSKGILALAGSDIGLSITGIAGPSGGSNQKPVGLVYIGISTKEKTEVLELKFPKMLPREEIRLRSANKALHYLYKFIMENFT